MMSRTEIQTTCRPEHPFAEYMVGPDGLPPPLFAQPMLHWLANIISSRAFADLGTVEEVLALQPPSNGNFRNLEWADDVKEKPVFPEWSPTGPKAKQKDPKSWVSQFSDWGRRAGFTAQFGLHAVRREALIKVNDNGYTLGQVLRFASQNNTNALINKYLGSVSTIDGAGSYLGMELRTDLVEDFRSATVGRNPNLRSSLPLNVIEDLRKSSEYLSYTQKIECLNSKIETTTSPDERMQLELLRKAAYKERRLVGDRNLREFQASQKVIYETSRDDYEQSDWRCNHFYHIVHVLPEERLRLASTLRQRAWPRSPEWIAALKDLITLRSYDYSVAYQKDFRPVQDCCPVTACRQDLTKVPRTSRWWHVYRCLEKSYRRETGFASFCFICSAWMKDKTLWLSHCKNHIEKLTIPIRCNPVTFRHAMACAGYCPVHLGRAELSAEERMRQWSDQDAWKRHISQCFSKYLTYQRDSRAIPCPHPRCTEELSTEKEFWHHQGDIHSIFEKSVPIGKRKRRLQGGQHAASGPSVSKQANTDYTHPTDPTIIPFLPREKSFAPKCRRDSSGDLPSTTVVDTISTNSQSPQCYERESSQSQNTDLTLDTLNSPLDSICGSAHQLSIERAYMSPNERNGFSHLGSTEYAGASAGFGSTGALVCRAETLLTEPRERELEELTTPIDPLLVLSSDAATIGSSKSLIASDATVMEVKSIKVDRDDTRGCCQEDISQEEAYSVDCLLGRWGKDLFYLRWLDGSHGWEPRENILDDDLLRQFEESYRGFKDGVEVLRTRTRNGKTEYRLHWDGRPKCEDWWVTEKEMHPELVVEHKPKKKSQRGRKRKSG
ncbi:hypothetical protein FSHL1_010059 [Fusarium sambucinum]